MERIYLMIVLFAAAALLIISVACIASRRAAVKHGMFSCKVLKPQLVIYLLLVLIESTLVVTSTLMAADSNAVINELKQKGSAAVVTEEESIYIADEAKYVTQRTQMHIENIKNYSIRATVYMLSAALFLVAAMTSFVFFTDDGVITIGNTKPQVFYCRMDNNGKRIRFYTENNDKYFLSVKSDDKNMKLYSRFITANTPATNAD